MKIYTEVNYIWKDDRLVQTDSKSFDYEGEVESCHWYHRHSTAVAIPKVTVPTLPKVPSITLPKGGTLADATNVLREGLHSGTSALKAGWDKMREDNPDPNLNIQTPDQILDKGRDALHDAATNIKKIWDRNRPSYGGNDEEYTLDPGPPDPDNPLLDEDTEAGSRGTASGRKTDASGATTSSRRGIEKKKYLATSLINQRLQKRLVS